MATYSSLNNAGATGTQAGYLTAPVYNPSAQATSPVSKALSNFSMGTPQTPVKTQSVTHPDGTKVDTTYHAPDVPIKAPATQASDVKQGQTITDTSGNQGVAKFNPTTGQAYSSTAPTSPTTPTYAGLIGQGASASQNAATTGSQNYNTANQDLLNSLTKNQEYADKAQQIADAEGQKISDIGGQGAKGEAGYLSTGTSPVAQGNSQLLANSIAAQQQAVSQGANAQLSGIDRALTAQGQTQSGLATASGNGLTAQGQGITGLGSNTGYLQPVSQFGVLTDPTTGQPINGNSAENAAIQGGKIQGEQSGAATAASATGGAQATLTQNYQTGLAQLRNADNLAPQISQTLASNPTLNQTPISAITNLNQWFAGQTSQPGQQQLSQQVAAYVQALGMTPDQAAAIASQQGGTIGTLLNNLYNAAKAKVDANNPTNISVEGNTGGNFTEGQTASSGGYDFVYQNGKWVPK